MLSTREYILKLERDLMVGSGRWVADFVESFWGYDVDGVLFDLFVHGGMRPQGYALSRLVARFAMPDYLAACFVHTAPPDLAKLSTILKAVRRHMKDRELQWSWLVLPGEQPFTSDARSRVEKNNVKELGIALVDLSSEDVVTNGSYPGRRMARFVRCFK
jgi:hypothetical protein